MNKEKEQNTLGEIFSVLYERKPTVELLQDVEAKLAQIFTQRHEIPTMNNYDEKILDEAVRDICAVSVTAAPKSKVREILAAAFSKVSKSEPARSYDEMEKEFDEILAQNFVGQPSWQKDIVLNFLRKTLSQQETALRERIVEVVGKHNARILNEYQIAGLGDERVLFTPIEKATNETLSALKNPTTKI